MFSCFDLYLFMRPFRSSRRVSAVFQCCFHLFFHFWPLLFHAPTCSAFSLLRFFSVTIFKNNLDTVHLSDCCHRAVRPSSRHGQCCPIRAVSDPWPAADQSQMSLYPTPLTLMIFTSGAFASLRRSLVINTCRLRALKKLSSPHNIMSMSRVSTTLL